MLFGDDAGVSTGTGVLAADSVGIGAGVGAGAGAGDAGATGEDDRNERSNDVVRD